MVKKEFVLLAAVVVLGGALAVGVYGQTITACYLAYQMYPYDSVLGLVIPGSACTAVPFMTRASKQIPIQHTQFQFHDFTILT